ncbi:DEAD/DEAH box helicase [Sphingobacterium alkalisoli]|uniref:DEAD/DEAH box helicase n=1 Tax=Sphingobacterium alkalisoli TaxID=1874115 RepID=A0A4U0H2N3_9SPHI|nr:DEAD/DEAH box helicase [Sphingobacterium alkalisoli]TJY65907.1 DEAD/DEAH box helicase [Sphingobacterium alkalisoli]GGH17557.1 helicase [Sphingobacterium alkalisoli]
MDISKILQSLNIESLNLMQLEVTEKFRAQQDLIVLSPTGTGKTLAFSLIINQLLDPYLKDVVQVLIVVPTRELALQIESVIKKVTKGNKITTCYGGHDTKIERNALKEAPSILIGTPGRLIYHLDRGHFNPRQIHTVVLDEFDKSLEFGFQGQMSNLLAQISHIEHKILTSATKLDEYPSFITLNDPIIIDYLTDDESIPKLTFKKTTSSPQHKLKTLFKLLCKLGDKKILIFCNHRDAVDHISELLQDRMLIHDVFHGGLEQRDRELALLKFRNNSNRILLTTDLAARGLDIPAVDTIIHYQLPYKEDAFVHRNGRTARMNTEGDVIVMLKPDDDFPYLIEPAEEIILDEEYNLPSNTPYATLYIPVGKKNKVNKIDLVGYTLQLDGIQKDDIGIIEVKDNESYIAVKRNVASRILKNDGIGKIKGNKIKFMRT